MHSATAFRQGGGINEQRLENEVMHLLKSEEHSGKSSPLDPILVSDGAPRSRLQRRATVPTVT
ncbi:hypothetical protein EYF80_028597 [Liparis tanakae]|uniref:Uncharacterized protein n=1 Tax=Liparis tanakae TaxID=230148 RepID=A0A4Z2H8X3_9TELE|nr:hypothetical protein EYF80_028597 [Liparis tanakae]